MAEAFSGMYTTSRHTAGSVHLGKSLVLEALARAD